MSKPGRYSTYIVQTSLCRQHTTKRHVAGDHPDIPATVSRSGGLPFILHGPGPTVPQQEPLVDSLDRCLNGA